MHMQPTSRSDDYSFETTSAVTPTQPQSSVDPELSEILNTVIDFVPEYPQTMLGGIISKPSANVAAPIQPSHQEINEKMAISAITESLMQCENTSFSSALPAYSMHSVNNTQSNLQNLPPPPVYSRQMSRVGQMSGAGGAGTVNAAAANAAAAQASRNQFQMQRERMMQQQQKERLLQQQQKQSLVVPVNATASADQLCEFQRDRGGPGPTDPTSLLFFSAVLSTGMSNYDMLNNVPPNVSLQRSSNVAPESQLSPGYAASLMQQQLSPNQRAPFSPQSNPGYQPFMNTGQRLSPQTQALNQQQQITFQAGANPNSNSQLSPRQASFPQGAPNQQQQTQPNQPQAQQTQQWTQAQINQRLSAQQQNNPMLNAQLQVGASHPATPPIASPQLNPFRSLQAGYPTAARQFQTQRQRTLNSPGANTVRQNSFNETGFPGPPSPSQAAYGPNMFNNQMRMQRQTSIPNATQHLPGF